VRLLLDEHISRRIAEELRERGHDVLAVDEAGLAHRPDEEVLAWAVRDRRAVVTANYRDFRALHELLLLRGERHSGLVLIPRRYSLSVAGFGHLIGLLDAFLHMHPSDDALDSAELWL
jgi:predicted nuclease of predicted toxin-antitoxin system